jgi:NAD(P)-dependent dehydrogenase (short-subunit alcohol dehydrogenase family)
MNSEKAGMCAVTGGASGIGKAVAEKFASEGHDVAIIDVNETGAAAVAKRISHEFDVEVQVFIADLSDRDACRSLADQVFAWKHPGIWVNNAGILRLEPALESSDSVFDSVMDTNFRSMFVLSVEYAKRMIAAAQRGSIVNISSIHAVLSEPNASVYTAAKGAIEASARTFASEWASRGIRVNCVRPGATYTELTNPIYTEEIKNAVYSRVPMRRIADASEIAEAVYFLGSDRASYCTGTTLDVDGGYVMDGSLPGTEYE